MSASKNTTKSPDRDGRVVVTFDKVPIELHPVHDARWEPATTLDY